MDFNKEWVLFGITVILFGLIYYYCNFRKRKYAKSKAIHKGILKKSNNTNHNTIKKVPKKVRFKL